MFWGARAVFEPADVGKLLAHNLWLVGSETTCRSVRFLQQFYLNFFLRQLLRRGRIILLCVERGWWWRRVCDVISFVQPWLWRHYRFLNPARAFGLLLSPPPPPPRGAGTANQTSTRMAQGRLVRHPTTSGSDCSRALESKEKERVGVCARTYVCACVRRVYRSVSLSQRDGGEEEVKSTWHDTWGEETNAGIVHKSRNDVHFLCRCVGGWGVYGKLSFERSSLNSLLQPLSVCFDEWISFFFWHGFGCIGGNCYSLHHRVSAALPTLPTFT